MLPKTIETTIVVSFINSLGPYPKNLKNVAFGRQYWDPYKYRTSYRAQLVNFECTYIVIHKDMI